MDQQKNHIFQGLNRIKNKQKELYPGLSDKRKIIGLSMMDKDVFFRLIIWTFFVNFNNIE